MNSTHRGRRFGMKRVGLSLSALMIVGGLLVPAAALAVGNTWRIEPATTNTSLGSTFTVQVIGNAEVATSGAQASVVFDKTRLQLTDLSNTGNDWTANGGGYAGYPSPANKPAFITSANAAGKVPAIAGFFSDGSSFLAPGDHTLYSLTFQVIAHGSSALDLPIGASDGGFLDGRAAPLYGEPVSPVTSTSGTVNAPAPTPTPVPTATPTPAPTAPLAPANGTTNVTGTVDAGFLGITVPANVTIPLNRLATNTRDVPVVVFSNISWNLSVTDPSVLASKGHMVDGTKKLQDAMFASVTPGTPVNLEVGGTVTSGNASANVPVTLSQYVGSLDAPGNYAISLVFQAFSGF